MKRFIKLGLVLLISYLVAGYSIRNLFLAQSPKLNPFFTSNMIAKVNNLFKKTSSFITFKKSSVFRSENQQQPIELNDAQKSTLIRPQIVNTDQLPLNVIEAINSPLQQVSKGVYAGEKNDIKVYEIRTGEIEYLEYTFNVNGKEIKIKVPKDQEPPSQEVVETLYK